MNLDKNEEWEVHGENPSTDPSWMVGPSQDHFQNRADVLNDNIPADHEVATVIKDKIVSVFSENKIIIEVSAAALGVAGVLYATHQLRRRRKK